jgi:hypothetical protein
MLKKICDIAEKPVKMTWEMDTIGKLFGEGAMHSEIGNQCVS